MPAQPMPQEDPSAEKDQSPKGVDAEAKESSDPMALVQDVGEGLQSLMQIPGLPPQVKQKLGDILGQFSDLVQSVMGQQDEGPQPADQGAASAQGGMSGVPMGPQTRQ